MSTTLSRDEAAKVGGRVGPMVRYLGLLRSRMEKTGRTADRRLYQAVIDAYNKVFALSVHLHYASGDPGHIAAGGPPLAAPGKPTPRPVENDPRPE